MSHSRAFVAVLLTAVVFFAGAGAPAEAADEYTPHGGPGIDFVGSNVAFTVDSTGQELDCPKFDLLGAAINPGDNRPFGDDHLKFDELIAAGCTNPIVGPTDVISHGEWKVAVTGPENGSLSPVNLHGVKATVDALSGACTYDLFGEVGGYFDEATQVFEPTVPHLEVASSPAPSGSLCALIGVVPGTQIGIDSGTWTNTPPAGSGPLVFADEYTPHGGPQANFVGSNVAFIVDSTGQSWTCSTFNLLAYAIDPGVSRAFGEDGLYMNDLTATGCTNPIAGQADFTPHGEWKLAVTGPGIGDVSPVNLYDVQFTVNWLSGGCTHDVVGDSAGSFDDASQIFNPALSNLEVPSSPAPSGFLCNVLGVAPGVPVSIDSDTYWTNTPPPGSAPLTFTLP